MVLLSSLILLSAGLVQQPTLAPEIGLKDTTGKEWKLENLDKDRVYFIEFWATWCTTCKANEPVISAFVKENRGKQMEFLAVSIDTDLKALAKEVKLKKPEYPVLIDSNSEMWKRWKVENVPHFFMIKNGQILWNHSGKVTSEELDNGLKLAIGTGETKIMPN